MVKIKNLLNQYSKFIVWGTGNYYYKFRNDLPGETAYFVDNNPEKWQTILDGKQILSPEVLKNENTEGTLIVVCNNYFDEVTTQLRDYGEFDVIDIVNIAMVREHERGVKGLPHISTDTGRSVLICAGIHAMWQRNGARKFIEGQIDALHAHGYHTTEAAPLLYIKRSGRKEEYLAVSQNRSYRGLFSVDEFVRSFFYRSVIIHSLYYNYKILERLAENKDIHGKLLYYLHDYFIICKNRFLVHDYKLCLDEHNRLHCDSCSESDEQKEIQSFHKSFFARYKVTLIAPSMDTKQRIRQCYQGTSVEMIPHLIFKEKTFERTWHYRLRIAFLGIALWQKGWDGFCEIVRNNYRHYDFFCIGDCEENKRKEHMEYLSVELDAGEHLTMPRMLRKYEIDIAYVGSILPETYSYTYFEAYEAGCFVITTKRSGNIYQQLEKNRNGRVFGSIDEMNVWLSDLERVREDVRTMNKKITQVKNNERFIDLIE